MLQRRRTGRDSTGGALGYSSLAGDREAVKNVKCPSRMPYTSPITTHVLDTALGRPAIGVEVQLARRSADNRWEVIATGATDADGRITNLLSPGALTVGVYCLTFAAGAYFRRQGIATFYPAVAIEFQVLSAAEHYHVPLLVSPFGYTTYRGS